MCGSAECVSDEVGGVTVIGVITGFIDRQCRQVFKLMPELSEESWLLLAVGVGLRLGGLGETQEFELLSRWSWY